LLYYGNNKKGLVKVTKDLDHSILEKLPIFEDLEGHMSHPLDR
jgi:hypothetical protein